MAKVLIVHECGHEGRVEVGDGRAANKGARAFRAGLEPCPACKRERDGDDPWAGWDDGDPQYFEDEDGEIAYGIRPR